MAAVEPGEGRISFPVVITISICLFLLAACGAAAYCWTRSCRALQPRPARAGSAPSPAAQAVVVRQIRTLSVDAIRTAAGCLRYTVAGKQLATEAELTAELRRQAAALRKQPTDDVLVSFMIEVEVDIDKLAQADAAVGPAQRAAVRAACEAAGCACDTVSVLPVVHASSP